jgi:ankyrin repeat protein
MTRQHRFVVQRRSLLATGAAALAALPAAAQMRIDNQSSPIFQHVRDGEIEDVRRLLIGGESANQNDRRNVPLIVVAADSGYGAIMALVLDYGALIESADPQGNTALIVAARRGNMPAISMLLTRRVRINAQNRQGVTALMEAAAGGHADTVRVLLQHKADPNITDYTGRTALAHAREGRGNTVESILRAAGAR